MCRVRALREGVAENGGTDDGGKSDETDNLIHKVVTPSKMVLTGNSFPAHSQSSAVIGLSLLFSVYIESIQYFHVTLVTAYVVKIFRFW